MSDGESSFPTLRLGYPVFLLVLSAAFSVAGFLFQSTWPSLIALGVAFLGLLSLLRQNRRVSTPALRRWRILSAEAKRRMQDHGSSPLWGRRLSFALMAVTLTLMLASGYSALRTQTRLEADLSAPGPVFLAYNRLADREMADLIELYLLRGLPLENASAEDLRLLRNLHFAVEGFSFESGDLAARFGQLIWYRPYRAFPNDLRALPERSRRRVERILTIERRRGIIRN